MNLPIIYRVLQNKKMPWGDYGSILLSGMAVHRRPILGRLQIERTGPFMPPIIDAGIWRFVLSHHLAALLREAHPDIVLKRAIRRKITWVDWRSWDLNAEKSRSRPSGGDPEGYVLDQWHSVRARFSVGPIYQFDGKRLRLGDNDIDVIPGLDSTCGKIVLVKDIVGYRTIFRHDIAQWLVDHGDGWVSLHPEYSWTVT